MFQITDYHNRRLSFSHFGLAANDINWSTFGEDMHEKSKMIATFLFPLTLTFRPLAHLVTFFQH